MSAMTGIRKTKAAPARMTSITRLIISRISSSGAAAKVKQRGRSEPVQIDFAIDVREKIDRDMGAHAFFIAQQERVFQVGQTPAIYRKNDLVDDLLLKDVGQARDTGWTRYVLFRLTESTRTTPDFRRNEAGEAYSVGFGSLQQLSDSHRGVARVQRSSHSGERQTRDE